MLQPPEYPRIPNTAFKGGTTTGLFWSLGMLFAAGFIGLLFGIPSPGHQANSIVPHS